MFPRILVETIDGKGQRGWAGAVARVEARLGSIRDPLPAIALISALWAAGAYAISGSVLAGCAVFAAALVGAWIMGVSCRSRVARRDAELARAMGNLVEGVWIGLPGDDALSRAIERAVRDIATRPRAEDERIAELARELAAAEERAEELTREATSTSEICEGLRRELDEARQLIETLRHETTLATDRIDSLVRDLDGERRRTRGWEDLRRRLNERADATAAELHRALDRVRDLEGQVEAEKDERFARERTLEAALEERNARLREIEGRDAERERELRRLEAEVKEKGALANEVDQLREELEGREADARTLRGELESKESELSRLRSEHEALLQANEGLASEVRARESELEQLREELEGREADARTLRVELASKESELSRLRSEHEALLQGNEGLASEVRARESELEQLREELRQGETAKSERDALVAEAERLRETLGGRSQEIDVLRAELESREAELRSQVEAREERTLQFFDDASGTLRTPIRLAARGVELLGSEETTPTSEERARSAVDVLTHLARAERTIDLIVELCRLRSPRLKQVWARSDSRRLIARTLADVREAALDRDIELADDLPIDLPEIVTDVRLVSRAVRELLTNAIEATSPGGRITVSARVEANDRPEAGGTFRVAVIDSGPGIALADQARIFLPFERASSRPQFKTSDRGAGLGLAVAKAAAERLGGTIELESAPDAGSRFALAIPARIGIESPGSVTPPAASVASSP